MRRRPSSNFIALARKGFFNGLQIHRVVPNFVVQDGDPRGDGEGGPGYTIRDELNERPYLRGTVGMALDVEGHGRQPVLHHALAAAAPRRALHRLRPRRRTAWTSSIGFRPGDMIQRVRVWDGHDDAVSVGRGAYAVQQKRGRPAAPFFSGRGELTASCRPSSSRPWLLSLPLRLSPPSLWDSDCEEPVSAVAAPLPPGTSACAVGARRFCC